MKNIDFASLSNPTVLPKPAALATEVGEIRSETGIYMRGNRSSVIGESRLEIRWDWCEQRAFATREVTCSYQSLLEIS